MAKIVALLPGDELYQQAHDVLQELKISDITVKKIDTQEAVVEARHAIQEGAEVIVARGLQAILIKQFTDAAVVDIALTREGMIEVLERAKAIVGGKKPKVALIVSRNMACDMSGLARKCGVTLMEYYIQNAELIEDSARQAIEDDASILIGGSRVCGIAEQAGIPSLFVVNKRESVLNAFREALRTLELIERDGEKPFAPEREEADEAFLNLPYRSEVLSECVKLARTLAESNVPKWIVDPGMRYGRSIALSIHNYSAHGNGRMITFDCTGRQNAYEELFGKGGALEQVRDGTLVLIGVEDLAPYAQRKLADYISLYHMIVISSGTDMKRMLIPDLYYGLSAFMIRIPPLNERRDDIATYAEMRFADLRQQMDKPCVLSRDALKAITELSWDGGEIQLSAFVTRLLSCMKKRRITEKDIRQLYRELYGGKRKKNGEFVYDDEEEDADGRRRILQTLKKNLGNREKTARELGISKTTLWRRLKEYGVD